MPSQIYEIFSLMMRYWFAALGVLIVLRAFWWLWKDHRSREKKRRSLPDAGSIGEFVVESDCAALPQDTLLPVPADGTLGSVRSCDIVVPAICIRTVPMGDCHTQLPSRSRHRQAAIVPRRAMHL